VGSFAYKTFFSLLNLKTSDGFSSGNLAEKLNPNASNGAYGGGLFIDYISL